MLDLEGCAGGFAGKLSCELEGGGAKRAASSYMCWGRETGTVESFPVIRAWMRYMATVKSTRSRYPRWRTSESVLQGI